MEIKFKLRVIYSCISYFQTTRLLENNLHIHVLFNIKNVQPLEQQAAR